MVAAQQAVAVVLDRLDLEVLVHHVDDAAGVGEDGAVAHQLALQVQVVLKLHLDLAPQVRLDARDGLRQLADLGHLAVGAEVGGQLLHRLRAWDGWMQHMPRGSEVSDQNFRTVPVSRGWTDLEARGHLAVLLGRAHLLQLVDGRHWRQDAHKRQSRNPAKES